MKLIYDTANSLFATAGVASSDIATALARGKLYAYSCTIGSWISQGATPTATAGAGSMFVPAGVTVLLSGTFGVELAILRQGGADGSASLTPVIEQ